MFVSIHSQNFTIDTDDWTCEESSEKANDYLEAWLKGLTEDEAKSLHSDLEKSSVGEIDYSSTEILERLDKAGMDAFYAGIEGWASEPTSGHNATVMAVTND